MSGQKLEKSEKEGEHAHEVFVSLSSRDQVLVAKVGCNNHASLVLGSRE